MVNLTWLIVCYGTPEEAYNLARSIAHQHRGVQVIISANAPGDFAFLRKALDDDGICSVVDASHNPGYLGALRELSNRIPVNDVVVLSNADISLGHDCLRQLCGAVELYSEAGMLAPSIVTGDGADQNPHLLNPPSQRKLRVLSALYRFPLLADVLSLRRRGHGAAAAHLNGTDGQRIFSGHGSCMIFTSNYRRQGGTWDYPCFLFGEELWCGLETHSAGLDVVYVPSVRMQHVEHATTGRRRRRGLVARAKYDSLRYWVSRATELGW